MISNIFRVLSVLCVLAFAGTAQAEDRATADEAVALVKKAVAVWKSDGKDKALAAYLTPEFQPKDLFIFVEDMKGVMIQHAKKPPFAGKDLSQLKDSDGKLYVAEQIKLAGEKGQGWVEYKASNPQTKKLERKSSYVERVDDIVIGAGIYKQ